MRICCPSERRCSARVDDVSGGGGSSKGGGRSTAPDDKALLRSALVSIAYDVHRQTEHGAPPPMVAPMDVDAAVEHLEKKAPDSVKLQAAAWLADRPKQQSLDTRIRRLIGSDAYDLIDGVLQKESHLTPSVSWHRQGLGGLETGPDSSRFARILEELVSSSTGFTLRNFKLKVYFDAMTLVTRVHASVEVNRPVSDFDSICDPRQWKQNVPLFFTESDPCDLRDGEYVLSEVATSSSAFPPSLLQEAVTLSYNPLYPIRARNVLVASHTPTVGDVGPDMKVRLYESQSTLIGFSAALGGLDVDSGSASAKDPSGSGFTTLSASKHARFTQRDFMGIKLGRWLNWCAPFTLGPWMALLVLRGAGYKA